MKYYVGLSYSIKSDLKYYHTYLKRYLASYWAIKSTSVNLSAIKDYGHKFFLDSGAFSAFTKDIQINIQDYIKFIKDNIDYIEVYSVLDVIGDAERTLENQKIMEQAGLKPIPCFHYGEDFKYLEYYIKNYKYIALGGLVPLAKRKELLKKHLDNCFYFIRDKVKVHLFGMSSKWLLERYPIYSSDSTSHFSSSIRGSVTDFNGKQLDPRKSLLGFSLMDKHGLDKRYRDRINFLIKQSFEREEYITNLWRMRGIVWED